jgi:hypothetical protein
MRKLAVMLFLACAGSIWGQSLEIWFNGGQSIMSNKGIGTLFATGGTKDDVTLEDGFRFSFRMTLNNDNRFGHEVQYAYSRTQLNILGSEQGMAIHEGGYNFLYYATKEGTRIRPFATGGIGFANFVPPGSSAASGGGNTKFQVNYGGGVKVHVASIFGVRFDVRQYLSPKPFSLALAEGWLRQTEVSGGFGVQF